MFASPYRFYATENVGSEVMTLIPTNWLSGVKYHSHRRRINTEEKAKVVTAALGAELIKFLAALAILYPNNLKNRMHCTWIIWRIVWIHPSPQNMVVKNCSHGKELNQSSDGLCLLFCLYPLSSVWLQGVKMARHDFCFCKISLKTNWWFSASIPTKISVILVVITFIPLKISQKLVVLRVHTSQYLCKIGCSRRNTTWDLHEISCSECHTTQDLYKIGCSQRHTNLDLHNIGFSQCHTTQDLPKIGCSQRPTTKDLPKIGCSQRHTTQDLPKIACSQRPTTQDIPKIGCSPRHTNQDLPKIGCSPRHTTQDLPKISCSLGSLKCM